MPEDSTLSSGGYTFRDGGQCEKQAYFSILPIVMIKI